MADLAVAVDRLVGPDDVSVDIVDGLASDVFADLETCAECDYDPFLACLCATRSVSFQPLCTILNDRGYSRYETNSSGRPCRRSLEKFLTAV